MKKIKLFGFEYIRMDFVSDVIVVKNKLIFLKGIKYKFTNLSKSLKIFE